MDKDQTEDLETTDQEETSNEEVVIEQEAQDLPEANVVVKKSGGGLSLLLSIAALGIAGYLFYQDWQQADSTKVTDTAQSEVKQLQQANQSLGAELVQVKAETAQLKQQMALIQESITEVKAQSSQQQPSEAASFDNSENERLLQQLEKQLADQAQSTSALQRQITKLPAAGAAVQELSPEVLKQLQNSTAVQALLTTQTLLDTGQIEAAGLGLERYLMSANANDDLSNQLQSLASRLKDIELPDVKPMKQELQSLSAAVKALELPTIETEGESQWYDRFISVKKISDESDVTSSVQLMELRVQLDRLLYQAGLYLTMQQPAGWQDTLNQAATKLTQNLPKQEALVSRLKALAKQSIRAEVPADLNIDGLINELKRLNP